MILTFQSYILPEIVQWADAPFPSLLHAHNLIQTHYRRRRARAKRMCRTGSAKGHILIRFFLQRKVKGMDKTINSEENGSNVKLKKYQIDVQECPFYLEEEISENMTYASIKIAASCASLKLPSSPLFRPPNVQSEQSNSTFCSSFAAKRKSCVVTYNPRCLRYEALRIELKGRTSSYVFSLNICLNSCLFHFSSAMDVVACHL